jgi:hypothetical protein
MSYLSKSQSVFDQNKKYFNEILDNNENQEDFIANNEKENRVSFEDISHNNTSKTIKMNSADQSSDDKENRPNSKLNRSFQFEPEKDQS